VQSPSLEKAKPTIAIVGCGKVGSAIGKLLGDAGYPISGVATSNLETARTAAQLTGSLDHSDAPSKIALKGEIVFITTPDELIESVCVEISEQGGFQRDAVVLHCCGALSSEILAPARICGAKVATMHPLQSFASVEQALSLMPGSFCAVEGDEKALSVVRKIVADLGGVVMEIAAEKKVLYHTAAVVASNYLVTLIHLALELDGAAGLDEETSLNALFPLIQGTLDNIKKQGVTDALTGPIVRGDVATVSAHLEGMKKDTPGLVSLYRCLGLHTVRIAESKGAISQQTADELTALLEPVKDNQRG
jgi:predicted short-subunit dehydrogenase-like oxidoreductase (DUF2520 family)